MSSSEIPALDASLEAHRLVARFLRSHRYDAALASFLDDTADTHPKLPYLLHREATAQNAPHDAGEDLQDVVDSWFAARVARLKVDDPVQSLRDQLDELDFTEEKGKEKAPARTALRETSNVLTVTKGVFPRRQWDSSELRFRTDEIPCIFTTAVDRTLKVYSSSTFELLDSFSLPSPALSVVQHPLGEQKRFILCATMEGSVTALDLVSREVKARFKDHTKYIVRAAWSPDSQHIATLGYDKLVHIYRFTLSAPSSASSADTPALLDGELPDPLATCPDVSLVKVHSITAKSNPEAAVWLPDSKWLVWTAREDHLLRYVRVPDEGKEGVEAWEETHYNLNENGDAFVSFSILSIGLHPSLPLLSLQTSTASARLLLYPFHSPTRLLTLHTTASQSDYFNPRHAWLPDGSAAVVNSEDGIVRIVDLHGRVVLSAGAHGSAAPPEDGDDADATPALRSERARLRREADKGSSVIRDVEVLGEEDAAGVPGRWRVVSCGFDKTVKVIE
ncbi:hypothetical protein JCM10450v2_004394 [Rhodotorula kratochvilovae]